MTGLALYAALAALVLLPALLPLDAWPPLRKAKPNGPGVSVKDSHAFNATFYIQMPSREMLGSRWVAVYAQEIAEWWIKWAAAFMLGLPLAIGLSFTPLWMATPIAAGIGYLFNSSKSGGRFREYIGHNAEILTARKLDITYPGFNYWDNGHSAGRVRDGYQRGPYAVFAGMTAEQVGKGLARWRPVARIVLALMRFRIGRHV